MTHPDYRWPDSVPTIRGMAPGEMRLVAKVAGGTLEELDTIDQVKASVFAGLLRDWREHHPNEEPDPTEIWEHAEWTQIDASPEIAARAALGNPTGAAT